MERGENRREETKMERRTGEEEIRKDDMRMGKHRKT